MSRLPALARSSAKRILRKQVSGSFRIKSRHGLQSFGQRGHVPNASRIAATANRADAMLRKARTIPVLHSQSRGRSLSLTRAKQCEQGVRARCRPLGCARRRKRALPYHHEMLRGKRKPTGPALFREQTGALSRAVEEEHRRRRSAVLFLPLAIYTCPSEDGPFPRMRGAPPEERIEQQSAPPHFVRRPWLVHGH